MNSTFFSDFLMITSFKTIAFILLLIGVFFIIKIMEKKKISFSIRMITGTILGLILGVIIQLVANMPADPSKVKWVSETMEWYGLVGYGFMDLLKMLVVPIVFFSIIRVIINMKDRENLGKLTGRSIGVLILTTTIAAIVGIVVGNLFKLGVGVDVGGVVNTAEMKEVGSLTTTLRGLLPSNIIKAMSEGNVVAVVIFAAFIGSSIKRLNKKYSEKIKPVVLVIEGSYKIITSVAMTVIKLMPYGVIPLLANTIAGRGLSSILGVLNFILAVYISIFIMFIIHLIIISFNGLNPFKYMKNGIKPLILAFTSRSSLGTLPVTIETLKDNMGLEEGIASFVSSLGANGGMNGCAAIYPALMTITIGNMAGISMDFSFYVMLVIIIVVSSLGIAGLPGTATVAVSVVVSGMGLGAYFPLVGGILAIDPILDMGRTMLNVNGTMVTAVTVANSFKDLDKEVFNKED